MTNKLTLEDLHLFHKIDREVFSRLMFTLARDPAEALLIMAFWLCLEDLNFQGIVFKIKSLSNAMLKMLSDEAVICLKCLESSIPPLQSGYLILQTESIVGRGISLIQIYQNKYTMITGIKTFLNKVCALVFTDILLQVYPSKAFYDYPLIIPGFPHPTFGSITIIPRRLDYVFPSNGIWGWSLNIEVPVDDRALFLTFSRGYPVTETEIRELFTSYYGDNCVEEVLIESSSSASTSAISSSSGFGEQRLYARLVLRDITMVDKILSKGPIAKYKINGKHVWAHVCNNESRLICMGSVSAANGSLYLTPDLPQQQERRKIGRVLFRYPVTAWPASFSTIFTVRFLTNLTVSGDGIAFVIAQDDRPSPSQSSGSYIGMLDPSTEGGVLHQLAVELDSYQNEHEIDDNHMAIVTTNVEYPVAVKSLSSTGVYLRSGRDITVKIDYDGWTKILQMSVAYAGNPLMSFLSHKIIMENTVPQSSYIGFTASTAYFAETHQVLSWNFSSVELDRKSLKQAIKKNTGRIVLSVVIPTLIVLLLVLLFIIRKSQKARGGMRRGDIEILARNAANAPRFFTYKQLARATRNFNKENLLGAGGFGCVYKGVLADPSTIMAVKKINATSVQGEREYLAEICTIGRLRHKNLVQLQGWCHDKEQLFLVYEYMPNGSLDRYIGKIILDWKTRFNILTGLASALLYLHEECGNPVVHRDVKPNNVMLDSDYNAHLGDFGLARLLQGDNFVTTMIAGTPGYLAPEVSYTGRATPESDVYSFGMVILEVVCGRRTRGIMEDNSLVDHVWTKHENNELFTCVDQTLEGKFEEEQMRRTILVGLACLHPDRIFRPRMRKVVQIFLNPDEPLMKVPESRPTAVSLSLHSSNSDSTTVTTEYDSIKKSHGPGSMESFPDEMTVVFEDSTDTKRMFISK